MGRWRLVVAGFGLVCVVSLLVGCSGDRQAEEEQTRRRAALQAAYDAVAAVQTATKAGVAYAEYTKLVPTASAALMAYKAPDDASRAVAEHLSAAVYAYQTAVRAWAVKYDECPDCAWRKFVSTHPQFAMEDTDPDYAVVTLWNQASGEMKAAADALTADVGSKGS